MQIFLYTLHLRSPGPRCLLSVSANAKYSCLWLAAYATTHAILFAISQLQIQLRPPWVILCIHYVLLANKNTEPNRKRQTETDWSLAPAHRQKRNQEKSGLWLSLHLLQPWSSWGWGWGARLLEIPQLPHTPCSEIQQRRPGKLSSGKRFFGCARGVMFPPVPESSSPGSAASSRFAMSKGRPVCKVREWRGALARWSWATWALQDRSAPGKGPGLGPALAPRGT